MGWKFNENFNGKFFYISVSMSWCNLYWIIFRFCWWEKWKKIPHFLPSFPESSKKKKFVLFCYRFGAQWQGCWNVICGRCEPDAGCSDHRLCDQLWGNLELTRPFRKAFWWKPRTGRGQELVSSRTSGPRSGLWWR